jgi:hypothetical protein
MRFLYRISNGNNGHNVHLIICEQGLVFVFKQNMLKICTYCFWYLTIYATDLMNIIMSCM